MIITLTVLGEYLKIEAPDDQSVTNINWTTERGQVHVRLEPTNRNEGEEA